ncbi:LytTR family DNA-binding domain-containing protein [Ekhidna sp.]|uniref:LytR/AlgR family response regulator transcription factor n=1 Tax=Ekhidna sp. TaxID=2608089 RepID=UPI0032F022FF
MESLIKKINNIQVNITASQLLRNLYVQTFFWVLMALLVFIQDYVDSSMNEKGYFVSDSLLFKIFWLLFIPCSMGWFWLHDFIKSSFKIRIWIASIILSLVVSLVHLLSFASLVSFLSNTLTAYGWSFKGLFYEVLSGRAYIVVIVYLSYAGIYPLLKERESSSHSRNEIKVKSGTKSFIIPTNEICWIAVEDAITRIKTTSRKYIYNGSLKNVIDQLDPKDFKQIHRSTVINLNEVDQLTSRLNGDYDLLMKDGTKLRLSRNYVKSVKDRLL